MKQIVTKSGKILVVEYPKEAYLIGTIDNPKFKYSIRFVDCPEINSIEYKELEPLGKLSELTDKDCEEFVLKFGDNSWNDFINYAILGYSDIIKVGVDGELSYRDYIDDMNNNYTLKPKRSFISLLKSEGIDTSKEWLIILVC